MTATAKVPLKTLSNEALLFATRELARRSRLVEADLIEHLGEIDERKLYVQTPYPSMFIFCMKEYGFSEGAAYNRIAVARAARKLTAVLGALRSGSVHLAGLRLLAPHLTEANCDLVLTQAVGRSKGDRGDRRAARTRCGTRTHVDQQDSHVIDRLRSGACQAGIAASGISSCAAGRSIGPRRFHGTAGTRRGLGTDAGPGFSDTGAAGAPSGHGAR